MSSRLNAFLAISLLIHLLVMGLLYDPAVQKLLKSAAPQSQPPPPAPSLTVLNHVPPPKPAPTFVPTIPSQEVSKENAEAILESERNTAIRSHDPAKDPNSPLPSMTGVTKNGLNYENTPSSPEVRSTPTQPSPAQKPTPPTPPQKPAPPQPETKPQQPAPPNPAAVPNAVKDAPPTPSKLAPPPLTPAAVPLLPAPAEVPKPSDKPVTTPPTPNPGQATQPAPQPQPTPTQQEPPAPQATPAPAQPPPSAPSFAMDRTQVSGGATPDAGDPSPESKQTEAGKYKAKLYKTIGSRWYLTVEQNMTLLQIGEVRVKFFVRANGVIDQISVSGTSGRTDILETISLKAVEKASGLMEPFSDSMKAQYGEGFWDEITFTIY